jgi:hypothetical protein
MKLMSERSIPESPSRPVPVGPPPVLSSPSGVKTDAKKSNLRTGLVLGGLIVVALAVWMVGQVLNWLFNPHGGVVTNAVTALPVASSWLDVKAQIGPIKLLTDPQHRAPALPDYIKPYVTPGDKCPFANDNVAKTWARFYETGIADGIWVRSDTSMELHRMSKTYRNGSPHILYVDSQMGRYLWALAQIERDGSGSCSKNIEPGFMAFPFTTLRDRARDRYRHVPYTEARARAARDAFIQEEEFSREKPHGKGVRRPTPEEAEFILSIWKRGKINFPRRVLYEIHDQTEWTLRRRREARQRQGDFGLTFDQKKEDLVSLELALRLHEMLTDTTPQEVEQMRTAGIAYIMNN